MSLFIGVSPDIRTSADDDALSNTTSSLTFGIEGSDGFLFRSNNYVVAWDEATYPDPADDPNARIGLLTGRSSRTLTVSWGSFDTPITALSGMPTIAQLFRDSEAPIQVVESISESYPKNKVVAKTVATVGTVADTVVSSTAAQTLLNSTITAVNTDGGGIVHMRAGTFTQSTADHIWPKSNVTLQGEGFATKTALASNKTIKIDEQSRVRIRDLYIDASNHVTETPKTFGIFIDRSSDVTVEDCWILDCKNFGIFVTNKTPDSTARRFRFVNNTITGKCNDDLIGGGPDVDTANVAEIYIAGNFIKQDATLDGAGDYLNAIDLVAQQQATIIGNTTYGGILLGGEKIPHANVNVSNNIVNAPWGMATGGAVGQIAILCASNTDPVQEVDSYGVNIISNHITSGNIFIQGQSTTSNRTRKIIISKNDIKNNALASYADHTYGINLNYVANVSVEGNIVDGAVRGISLTNTDAVDISNNTFINCTTPIVLGGTNTKLTGRNNIGINPDVLYAQGNVTGATTFDRVNGRHITATLTGNITVTLPNTFFRGELMTLQLTQDGTGNRTVTWPSNFKKAGGSLALSTGASATDVITMRWDGTNWVEEGRSLNIS